MNKFLKYTTLLTVSLGLMVSCRDDEEYRFPEFQEGVNARVVFDPDRAFFDFGDINNATIAFDVYSQNKNIDQIVYTMTFNDASDATAKFQDVEITVPGSAFTNGKASVELSAAELAEMFNLPGGISYIGGGDNVTFVTTATLTDGRVFDASNSAPSITGGTNASFTTQFNVLVACAFDVNEAVGTYTITSDPFGASLHTQVEVVAGAEPGTVILKDLLGHPQQFDIELEIDVANGAATVAKQEAWDSAQFGLTFGIASVEGAGFFLSCAGSIRLTLEHTVAAGSYGNYVIELKKN